MFFSQRICWSLFNENFWNKNLNWLCFTRAISDYMIAKAQQNWFLILLAFLSWSYNFRKLFLTSKIVRENKICWQFTCKKMNNYLMRFISMIFSQLIDGNLVINKEMNYSMTDNTANIIGKMKILKNLSIFLLFIWKILAEKKKKQKMMQWNVHATESVG